MEPSKDKRENVVYFAYIKQNEVITYTNVALCFEKQTSKTKQQQNNVDEPVLRICML